MPENTAVDISVVIPVYNRTVPLLEALETVLSQDGVTFEVIIVDDGSTEDTASAVDRFLSTRFPDHTRKVRCLKIDHSGMPGKVRNAGGRVAAGRYLAFLDSDDLWMPGKLKTQRELMRLRSEVGISHTREIWLRNGREISQKGQSQLRDGMLFHDALKKCIMGPSTVMIDRRLFEECGGFREDLEIAEDYEFWLRITAFHPVAFLDDPLTVKRAGAGDQLSEKYGMIEYFRIQALRRLVDECFFPGREMSAARQELSRKCSVYAAGCLKRGRRDEADEYSGLAERYSIAGE